MKREWETEKIVGDKKMLKAKIKSNRQSLRKQIVRVVCVCARKRAKFVYRYSYS